MLCQAIAYKLAAVLIRRITQIQNTSVYLIITLCDLPFWNY